MNQMQIENNKKLKKMNKIGKQGPKIIKKYGNRKLYDTERSSYIILKDIEKMIRNEEDIQIIDNDTQDDITISTLTQIIFSLEKQSKVSPPVDILKSIIRDGSFSSFLVKLGIFNPTSEDYKEGKSQGHKLLTSLIGQNKTNPMGSAQNLTQKITNLMNSGDGLNTSNEDDTVPNLPGNQLS